MTVSTQVLRRCVYTQSGDETLFGWIHSSRGDSLPVSVIICNPLGVEYMSGHRSIRHLADGFAQRGIETLRFDYAFTGDSSGGNFTHASISGIIANIQDTVIATKRRNPEHRITLVGIGLGGTFAAIACQFSDIDRLIMWNPTVSGKRFVREQKLLSEVITRDEAAQLATTDVAGIVLTPTLQNEFKEIDLASFDYGCVKSVLLIDRQDRKPSAKLSSAIKNSRTNFSQMAMPGYKEMMDQPTDTVVPVSVIERIVQWTEADIPGTANLTTPATNNNASSNPSKLVLPIGDHTSVPLLEFPQEFGPNEHLFGIVSMRQDVAENGIHKRAFLFLNCGSEHHAGPHRMYTILARQCASFGYLSFRFDIEGIGDSISVGNNADNNSYSPVALQDIEQAIAHLAARYGCKEFILSGICAGAYHTFKATAEFSQFQIVDSNLINPLVFEWNYDDPDDHLRFEAHTYRKTARDINNWRRLFTGDINYRRLFRALTSYLREYATRAGARLVNIFHPGPVVGLPRDMRAIETLDRKLALVLSEGDPGLDIMRLQARREVASAIKRGRLSIHTLSRANHGLSKKSMQDQLVDYFVNKYKSTPVHDDKHGRQV